MFRITSLLVKFRPLNFNRYNKILRNFRLPISQNNLLTIFKEPINADLDLLLKDIQQKDLIRSKHTYRTKYSKKEIQILYEAVMKHGMSWNFISEKYFSTTRTPISLSIKWNNLIQLNDNNKIPFSFYIRDKESFAKEWTREWTEEEDNILLEKVHEYGYGNWAKISKHLLTKNTNQITYRYKVLTSPKNVKWTKENDQHLLYLVEKFGKDWEVFSKILNRPYYAILYRYTYLSNPSKPWSNEENIKLNNAIINCGENWVEILKLFPNRKLCEIKSHYRTNPKLNPFVNTGRWDNYEIKNFLVAFKKFGKNWKKVAGFIETRTPIQCYSYWKYNYVTKYKSKK